MEKTIYVGVILENKKIKLLNDEIYENDIDKKFLIDDIKNDLTDEEYRKEFPNTKWGYAKLKIKEKDIIWIDEIN